MAIKVYVDKWAPCHLKIVAGTSRIFAGLCKILEDL